MDAVKYLTELNRMCAKSNTCDDCPIYKATKRNCGMAYSNAEMLAGHVGIVEQWAKEHPVRTRQSVFLERYPDANVHADGALAMCPQMVIKNYECYGGCPECRKHYWSQEVPE